MLDPRSSDIRHPKTFKEPFEMDEAIFRSFQGFFCVDSEIAEIVFRQLIEAHAVEIDSWQLALGDLAFAFFEQPFRVVLFDAFGRLPVGLAVAVILDPIDGASFIDVPRLDIMVDS
jgi:hypothetical protein